MSKIGKANGSPVMQNYFQYIEGLFPHYISYSSNPFFRNKRTLLLNLVAHNQEPHHKMLQKSRESYIHLGKIRHPGYFTCSLLYFASAVFVLAVLFVCLPFLLKLCYDQIFTP